MHAYSYTAVTPAGKTVRGKITAKNDLDFEDRLAAQQLTIIDYRAQKPSSSFRRKVTNKELIMFCIHMEQLDKAGVPLLDSLADIRDSVESQSFRNVITELYESVSAGEILSAAMARQPSVFDNVFIGLIAAGEETGRMSEAFGQLAHHLKWTADLRRKIKKAMTSPIILIVVMSCVVSLMMMKVVPELTDFLQEQGFELPWYTTLLIDTSHTFVESWYYIFGIPIFGIIIIRILYRKSYTMKYKMDKIILKIPIIGAVVHKINLARFSHFFCITFSSGIGVLECLQTAKGVVGNAVMQEAIDFIARSVSDGSPLTRAIAATGNFPGLVVRMFKVGEDSGNMTEALENVNFFYDREVEDSVGAMIETIQPTMTIVMGIIMFWIIAAVFGPLYQSFAEMDF